MADMEPITSNTHQSDQPRDAASLPPGPAGSTLHLILPAGGFESEETGGSDTNLQDLPSSNVDTGSKQHGEVTDYDPGIVNVHQFYPVLGNTASSGQLVSVEKDAVSRIGYKSDTEENGLLENTQFQATNLQEDKEDDVVDVDKGTAENKRDGDVDKRSIQVGLFSTSVDEESIEAARQRLRREGGYNKGRKLVKKKADEHFQRAMKLKDENEHSGVITCLSKAVNLTPQDPGLFVERAEAFLCLCDFQSAILNYKKACLLTTDKVSLYPRLAFLYCFQGQTFMDEKLFSQALESFSEASRMFPENVGYHMRCISVLAAMERHNECLNQVNKRLAQDIHNPDLYILRARLHDKFRNTSSCYYDVREALTRDPHHPEAQAMMEDLVMRANSNKQLSMELSIAGRHKEALQRITSSIQANPQVAEFHVFRGSLHRKLTDFDSAIDDFLLAMDKCGHNEQSHIYKQSQRQLLLTFNDFAVECFKKSCYEEALVLLNRSLREEKNEKALYVNRGDCLLQQNEVNFALEDYQQALELDPQDAAVKLRISHIYNHLGAELHQEKRYLDAEVKLSMALEYSPLIGHYYISRSRTRCMTGDLSGARDDLILALILSPKNEDIMPILPKLFPGKSLADVVKSPAAQVAQAKLVLLSRDRCSEKNRLTSSSNLIGRSDSYSIGQGGAYSEYNQSDMRAAEKPRNSFAMCVQDYEFFVQQAEEKRKVEHKVKDVLLKRKTLGYDGPQILPLAASSSSKSQEWSRSWKVHTTAGITAGVTSLAASSSSKSGGDHGRFIPLLGSHH